MKKEKKVAKVVKKAEPAPKKAKAPVVIEKAKQVPLKKAVSKAPLAKGKPEKMKKPGKIVVEETVEEDKEEIEGLSSIKARFLKKGKSAGYIDQGDIMIFKAIATPFHTNGSVCYLLSGQSALFSGDTLFHLGIGRSDLPGSSPRNQRNSLAKLRVLPPSTKVYPGHGPMTTIANELANNEDFI